LLNTKPFSWKTFARPIALAAAMTGVAAAQPATPAAIKEDWKQYLPPGPAKTLVETRCGVCHELRTVVVLRKTEAAWRMVIEDMVNRGAPLVPEEEEQIAAYLGAVFGLDAPPLTDVNVARQADLVKLPGMTAALADRLIAHRMTKAFSSRDEVKAVTGLDEAAFEKIRWYLRAAGNQGE
jgi:hypothetical protein